MEAFLLAFVVPLVIGFWAQHRVKSTVARNLQVSVANGMSGAQVARRILDANGLQEVPVEQAPGSLTDHYDPRSRSVHLSEPIFNGSSVAATAIGMPRFLAMYIPTGTPRSRPPGMPRPPFQIAGISPQLLRKRS